MLLLCSALLLLLLLLYTTQIRKPKGFPPGPPWIPFFGSKLQFNRLTKKLGSQSLAMSHLAAKYKTNILGLKLGRDKYVVVFDLPTARKLLTEGFFDGRPDNFFFRLRCFGTRRGITSTEGKVWSKQRSFVVKHLRSLGFGTNKMEAMAQDEIVELLANIANSRASRQINEIFAPAIINILWRLTTGRRFRHSDTALHQLLELLTLRNKMFNITGGALSQFPFLRFLFPKWTGFALIQELNGKLREFILESVNSHYETWTPGRDDDLIYRYISEIQNNPEIFNHEELVMVCVDLFIAGVLTTSSGLSFAFLMLLTYPAFQEKLHQEIASNLGRSGPVTYADRHKVPHVEAFLLECQRFNCLVPYIGPRRAPETTKLDQYTITDDIAVMVSVPAIHFDKAYWKDPEVFRPERFLDEHNELINHDHLVQFGLGRRRCLGDALAKTSTFVFFTQTVQRFRLKRADQVEVQEKSLNEGILVAPKRFLVDFVPRVTS